MLAACWGQRTTLDAPLPSRHTPFRPLLGQDDCKQLDAMTPDTDGRGIQGRVNTFVAGKISKTARNYWKNITRVSSIRRAALAPR